METRIQTGWHRLDLRQDCSGRLPYWEQKSGERKREREGREREAEGGELRKKKGKTWHGSVKSASFVCFLRLSFRKKTVLGYRKLRTFLVFKLRRLLSLLGYLKVLVHTMAFRHQY